MRHPSPLGRRTAYFVPVPYGNATRRRTTRAHQHDPTRTDVLSHYSHTIIVSYTFDYIRKLCSLVIVSYKVDYTITLVLVWSLLRLWVPIGIFDRHKLFISVILYGCSAGGSAGGFFATLDVRDGSRKDMLFWQQTLERLWRRRHDNPIGVEVDPLICWVSGM